MSTWDGWFRELFVRSFVRCFLPCWVLGVGWLRLRFDPAPCWHFLWHGSLVCRAHREHFLGSYGSGRELVLIPVWFGLVRFSSPLVAWPVGSLGFTCEQEGVRVLVPHGLAMFSEGSHPEPSHHGALQPRQHLEGPSGDVVSMSCSKEARPLWLRLVGPLSCTQKPTPRVRRGGWQCCSCPGTRSLWATTTLGGVVSGKVRW